MSEHNHSHGCGCGSHSHHHEHHGCCHHSHSGDKNCCGEHKHVTIKDISHLELNLLKHLLKCKFLPVARFIIKSSKEHDFTNVALSPVFIINTTDSMEEIKSVGVRLKNLESLGLITLDYDITLNGYDYLEYHNSNIYDYFKQTVNEAGGKDGFLGDTPTMECGSIAPSEKCIEMLQNNS